MLEGAYFDPAAILRTLGLTYGCRCAIDVGCAYGTIALPAAQLIRRDVHAFDLDQEMIRITSEKAAFAGLRNVHSSRRDFVEEGFGFPGEVADFVMLFNILRAIESLQMLQEAERVLTEGGKLGVIHWNRDPKTPRGPSMKIRLTPERCQEIVREAGFDAGSLLDLPPHHNAFTATLATHSTASPRGGCHT